MSSTEDKLQQSKLEVENAERLKKALADLQQAVESSVTPKNIRKVLKDTMNALVDAHISVGVRAANAYFDPRGAHKDPNMPSFSRVTMWSALSNLEAIREQV